MTLELVEENDRQKLAQNHFNFKKASIEDLFKSLDLLALNTVLGTQVLNFL